ncbi:MAG: UDP-N-acetyl glucosamine 2-epimerase [Candidatus Saccharimonadales bacterium]
MAPLILEIEQRNLSFQLIMTGQHLETMQVLKEEFGIKTQASFLYEGKEISGIAQTFPWLLNTLRRLIFSKQLKDHKKIIVLVHGDTLSTLVGAIAGRLRRCRVAHIESGLRSFNLLHPFPEELTRLAIFRLANIAYCPGNWACKNLDRFPHLTVIDTQSNTLVDAVRFAQKRISSPQVTSTTEILPYAVASIHRFENIFKLDRLNLIVQQLKLAAKDIELRFVLHPATRKKLTEYGLITELATVANIKLIPRMSYLNFMAQISEARFVITDGGGNQEELSYLGIPTLLMRAATERLEGIGSNVVIGNYNTDIMTNFLANIEKYKQPSDHLSRLSASKLIVDSLCKI